jgi:pilus assembly protein CpaF
MAFRRYSTRSIGEVKVQEPEAAISLMASWRGDEARETKLYEVKSRIHHQLLERLDLSQMENLEDLQVAREIRQALEQLFLEESEPINLREKNRLIQELEFEILGLGPLEPLLTDPTISDILANRFDQVYIERRGLLEKTQIRFRDNSHLLKIINKIVSNVGRRIDESNPMVDARLPDGSRVNAIIPPLALDGPMLSIRRFSVQRPTLERAGGKRLPDPGYRRGVEGHGQWPNSTS